MSHFPDIIEGNPANIAFLIQIGHIRRGYHVDWNHNLGIGLEKVIGKDLNWSYSNIEVVETIAPVNPYNQYALSNNHRDTSKVNLTIFCYTADVMVELDLTSYNNCGFTIINTRHCSTTIPVNNLRPRSRDNFN